MIMKGMEKFACANWRLVNMGKKDGGLGVLDLKILNLALLGIMDKKIHNWRREILA
jgi:hypothetical protein